MSLGSDHSSWNESGPKASLGAHLPSADGFAAMAEPLFEGGSMMERLRITMGDERANGVIRTIGTAALNAAPNGLPVSLDTIVSGTLNRLTQADLAGLVRGDTGVINRVGAMAEEQVKAAQAAQPSQNVHAASAGKADGTSPNGHGGAWSGKMLSVQGGDRARSEGGTGSPNGGRPSSSEAYNHGFLGAAGNVAFLQSQGLNAGIGKELGKLGFTKPEQIRQIVNDAHQLNLAPKAAALDIAHLRHGEGAKADQHIHALKQYGTDLAAARAMENDAQKIQDPAKRAEAVRKATEARQQAEKRADEYRRKNVKSSEGGRGFDGLRRQIRQQDQNQIDLKGDKSAHNETYQQSTGKNQAMGAASQIEAAHRTTVSKLESKPDASKADEDLFAAAVGNKTDKLASKEPAEKELKGAGQAKPEPMRTDKKSDVAASDKKPDGKQDQQKPIRQAANTKSPTLTA